MNDKSDIIDNTLDYVDELIDEPKENPIFRCVNILQSQIRSSEIISNLLTDDQITNISIKAFIGFPMRDMEKLNRDQMERLCNMVVECLKASVKFLNINTYEGFHMLFELQQNW